MAAAAAAAGAPPGGEPRRPQRRSRRSDTGLSPAAAATGAAAAGGPRVDVAKRLAGRGSTVRQVLTFYLRKFVREDDTTEKVVRDIVIPETAALKTSYMSSPFMRELGGPSEAEMFVSHAWKAKFSTTVLNILLDAADLSSRALEAALGFPSYIGALFERALERLDGGILDKSYWLCIFAVNGHFSICGDCRRCRPKTSEELARPRCKDPPSGCGRPKLNPCGCGNLKHRRGDDLYEMDKFDGVVGRTQGLVVSLDPALASLARIWVVAEIAEASRSKPIVLRMARGVPEEVQNRLLKQEPLAPPVAECEATSEDDKRMLLGRIENQSEFNEFIWSFLEVSFGMCWRLASARSQLRARFQRLTSLHIHCSWHKELARTSELQLGSYFDVLQHLVHLEVQLKDLQHLVDISTLTTGLGLLRGLQHLQLDFSGCRALADISSLGQGFAGLPCLEQLELHFRGCESLTDISGLSQGLAGLSGLRRLELDFQRCGSLADISDLGQGLGVLPGLRLLKLNFAECRSLADVSWLGRGLAALPGLQRLELSLGRCSCLADVSGLGRGLAALSGLRQVELNFECCERLADLSGPGGGGGGGSLAGLLGLCRSLANLSGLGPGLAGLPDLQVVLDFEDCPRLVSAGLAERFEHLDDFLRAAGLR